MAIYKQVVHRWLFGSMPFEEQVRYIRDTGADGIDLNMHYDGPMGVDIFSRKAAEYRHLIKEEGLTVYLGTPMYYDARVELCSEDAKVRKTGIEYTKKVVDAAAEYGAHRVLVSPSRISADTSLKLSYEEHFDLAADSLAQIAEYAATLGSCLMIEPINRYRVALVHTVREGIAMIRRTGSDNVYLAPDVFHMYVEEIEGIVNALYEAGPYLKCLHIGDAGRTVPGRGVMDWKSILFALDRIGFDGVLSYEPAELYFDEKQVASDPECAEKLVKRLRAGICYMDQLMKIEKE